MDNMTLFLPSESSIITIWCLLWPSLTSFTVIVFCLELSCLEVNYLWRILLLKTFHHCSLVFLVHWQHVRSQRYRGRCRFHRGRSCHGYKFCTIRGVRKGARSTATGWSVGIFNFYYSEVTGIKLVESALTYRLLSNWTAAHFNMLWHGSLNNLYPLGYKEWSTRSFSLHCQYTIELLGYENIRNRRYWDI